jgi:hypothetical protein
VLSSPVRRAKYRTFRRYGSPHAETHRDLSCERHAMVRDAEEKQRLSVDRYRRYRQLVMQTREGRELIEWAQNIRRPTDCDDLANRLIGAILSSGFSYETAMRVVPRVLSALRNSRPVSDEFGHRLKAPAIESVWRNRETLFERLSACQSLDDAFRWCLHIPFVRGPALRYQAIRDLGLGDVAKPDRLMQRIAEISAESVQGLCQRLSRATGDSVGTVDVVLWYAASKGIFEGIRVPQAHPAVSRRSPQSTSNLVSSDSDNLYDFDI